MSENGLHLRPEYAQTTWGVTELNTHLTTSIRISDAGRGHEIGPRYSSKAPSWDRLCLESNTAAPPKPRHEIGFAWSPIQMQHMIQNKSCLLFSSPLCLLEVFLLVMWNSTESHLLLSWRELVTCGSANCTSPRLSSCLRKCLAEL